MQTSTDPRVIKRILLFSGLIVTLSMGIRHSFGLYLSPMTLDLGWGENNLLLPSPCKISCGVRHNPLPA